MRLTINRINKEIAFLGDIKLHRAKDYHYFYGGAVSGQTYSIYVCKTSSLNLEQWINEAREATKDSNNK